MWQVLKSDENLGLVGSFAFPIYIIIHVHVLRYRYDMVKGEEISFGSHNLIVRFDCIRILNMLIARGVQYTLWIGP